MDVLHEGRLSALPIRTIETNSQMVMVCDRQTRYFSALTVPDAKVTANFRWKKEFMNENYLKLICQLNDTTFVFAQTQYFGSWKSDLRAREHGAIIYNFQNGEHRFINFTVLDFKLATMNNALVLVDTVPFPSRRWQIYTFGSSKTKGLDLNHFAFFEPPQLKDHYACHVAGYGNSKESNVLYFNQKPGETLPLDKIAMVKLDDKLRMAEEKELPVAPFTWHNCQCDSDVVDGWPTGKMLNAHSLKLLRQKDNLLCFAEVEPDVQKPWFLSCKGLWLLILEWPSEPRWKHVVFQAEKLVSQESTLVINDENEVYVVHIDDDNDYHLTFLAHLEVPSLKHLGAKQVISNSAKVGDEHVKIVGDLPKGCIPGAPWLNNTMDAQFTEEEKRSVIMCNLTRDEFYPFCSKRLDMSKEQIDETVIESVTTITPRKITVKFKNVELKEKFLAFAKLVEDDRYTATIVEIYDYCSSYTDNVDPIFISVPGDIILL